MANQNSLVVLAIFIFVLYLAASGKLTQIIRIINPSSAIATPQTNFGANPGGVVHHQ